MLNAPDTGSPPEHRRNSGCEKTLWHDGTNRTPSLGCTACPDREICGGLSIGRAFYDCYDTCCGDAASCDAVCRHKPRAFAQRIREIDGFRLDNVPRALGSPAPLLPPVVPVLLHGSARRAAFAPQAVCVPLYRVIARHSGRERYADAAAVAAAFRFKTGTPLILTGTADDRPLERWWGLGPARLDAIRKLRDLGVVLVTTPNFSLFVDQPRWDDLHSLKRIALAHEEFLREGIPAALHVSARTEKDWERWTEYIRLRAEVTHLAFEYKTGAGRVGRIDWQVAQLIGLAQSVERPLHLIVRAAHRRILPRLVRAFGATTVLDTNSFMKAIMRRRAVEATNGRIHWEPCRTAPGAMVDDLLETNWSLVNRSYHTVFHAAEVGRVVE